MDSNYHNSISTSRKSNRDNIFSCLYIRDENESEEEVINEVKSLKSNDSTKKDLQKIGLKQMPLEDDNSEWIPAKKKKQEKKFRKPKTHVGLWYNDESWQYKLVNDLYVFKENNNSVLEKYDISFVKKMFQNAKNNYKRNKAYYKLMQVITLNEWDQLKDKVREVKSTSSIKKNNTNSVSKSE